VNPDPSTQTWLDIVFAAALTVGGWFINRYVSKVDALEKQQAAQQATFVTREELKEYLDEIKADRVRMHQENLENLREIRNDLKELRK
jgi:cell division septum initiation protein DivIVA